jgi:DNA-binding TFAR19-related protein (PDSD5 family)
MSLEFMGVVETHGLVVRLFRMYLTKQVEERRRRRRLAQGDMADVEEENTAIAMMETGIVPNVIGAWMWIQILLEACIGFALPHYYVLQCGRL